METLLNFSLYNSALAFWFVTITFLIIEFSIKLEKTLVGAILFLILYILVSYSGDSTLASYFTTSNIIKYFIFGLFFTFFRTMYYGKQQSKYFFKYRWDKEKGDKNFKDLKIWKEHEAENLKNKVLGWLIFWPISLIKIFVGELIRDVFKFVYKKLKSLYKTLFSIGFDF